MTINCWVNTIKPLWMIKPFPCACCRSWAHLKRNLRPIDIRTIELYALRFCAQCGGMGKFWNPVTIPKYSTRYRIYTKSCTIITTNNYTHFITSHTHRFPENNAFYHVCLCWGGVGDQYSWCHWWDPLPLTHGYMGSHLHSMDLFKLVHY